MPIGDLLAQISGSPSPTEPTHTIPLPKRKADEQLRKPVDKIQRTGSATTTPTLSKPTLNNGRSLSVEKPMSKVKLGPSGRPTPPLASDVTKPGGPTPPPVSAASRAPPKKGSFAEIMARGKAAQSTLGQVGKIQHKKIEKLPSKREREEMRAQKGSNLAKNLAPDGKFNKTPLPAGQNGRNGVKEGVKKAALEPEKKIKKAATATTGYAGTARPKPGAKPTSRPSASASASSSRYDRGPDRHRGNGYGSSARYAYVSEEEEDEEEDERDYDSDASSDMEAAAFEVDEEEELAARIARKEDAEALAEENKLKREKEEKRRRLAAMAKSRR